MKETLHFYSRRKRFFLEIERRDGEVCRGLGLEEHRGEDHVGPFGLLVIKS